MVCQASADLAVHIRERIVRPMMNRGLNTDHHSLTEVDEIHMSIKETASCEVTLRLSVVHIEMERPVRRPAQKEDESNGDERRHIHCWSVCCVSVEDLC